MPDIQSIRQQYPQYGDLSDEQLAGALHQKFYADMPQDQFNQKIGFKPETPVEKTGKAFDVAAGKGVAGLGRTAVAAGENALSMASGVAGDIAGAATSVATQNPKKGEAVRNALTYEPKTEAGKAGQAYIGALAQPVAGALNKPVQALEKSGHPILAQTARAAEDVAPLPVPKALREAGEAARPVAEKIAKAGEEAAAAKNEVSAPKEQLIKDTKKLGLKLTSQDVGAPIGKRVEAAASRPQLEREISMHNANAAKKAAAADVDIKGPLTAGSVQQEISKTLSSYKTPRKLGRVNLADDKKWQAKLQEVEGATAQEKADFPEDYNEKVNREVAKFSRPSADADTLITKIAKLRESASDNFRGNAEDKALARAQRSIADGMEEAVERHAESVGKPGVMKQFKADRTKLAKLYTIRDALTESGELDLKELEKRLNNKEPLSGNLKTLAQAKGAFDRSFQNPENIRGHSIGAGDIALGIVAGGGHGATAGGLAGLGAGALAAGARPAARAILGSKAYQKAFIKARAYKPSIAA